MKLLRTLGFGALFLGTMPLVSCGSDQQAVAGKPAGSETSEELSARVIDADGLPVKGASVRLRPSNFLAESAVSKDYPDLVTDSQGNVALPVAPQGRWTVEVRSRDKGVVVNFHAPGPGKTMPAWVLQPYGRVKGRVDLPYGSRKAYVRLVGIDRIDSTDSMGNFDLAGLSPSDSALALRLVREGTGEMLAETLVQIKSAETIDLGKTYAPSLLLTDFEQGMLLNTPCHCASWWIDPPPFGAFRGVVDTVTKGHGGSALKISYPPGGSEGVNLHANLGGIRNLLDLDSIELWARGKGQIKVYIWAQSASTPLLLDSLQVEDMAWKRFVVKPWSSFAWQDLLKGTLSQTVALSIRVETAVQQQDLMLDDVRLYGVSLRDWN